MGSVYARLIFEKKITLVEVPDMFREDTKTAYFRMYGEPLEENPVEEKEVVVSSKKPVKKTTPKTMKKSATKKTTKKKS